MQKKSFESEFDKICEEKHREKELRKKRFNDNIRSHIVYMDENGKVYKRDSKKQKLGYYDSNKMQKNKYEKRKDVTKIFIIFMIVVMIYLIFDLLNIGVHIY